MKMFVKMLEICFISSESFTMAWIFIPLWIVLILWTEYKNRKEKVEEEDMRRQIEKEQKLGIY